MPSAPQKEMRTAHLSTGPSDYPVFTAKSRDGTIFMVAYIDYGKQDFDLPYRLDSGRDELLAQLDATLESEKLLTLNGHPGRELVYRLRADGTVFYQRWYCVNTYLYQLMVAPSGAANAEKNAQRFLESFRLLSP
jgi:predicted RNA-binding protein with PUA domain